MKTYDLHGTKIGELPASGPLLATEQDAVALLSEALGQDVDLVVIPTSRLHPDFFRLRSGLLGAFVQKFTNYRRRVACVGDISAHLAASEAFRAFVVEANRTRTILFARDAEELTSLLA